MVTPEQASRLVGGSDLRVGRGESLVYGFNFVENVLVKVAAYRNGPPVQEARLQGTFYCLAVPLITDRRVGRPTEELSNKPTANLFCDSKNSLRERAEMREQ